MARKNLFLQTKNNFEQLPTVWIYTNNEIIRESDVAQQVFSGKAKDFQQFYDRFSAIMTTYKDHYPDADKCSLLSDAMLDHGAKKLVEDNASDGYKAAMEQLRTRYGRASVVFPQLVDELVAKNRQQYGLSTMWLPWGTSRIKSTVCAQGTGHVDCCVDPGRAQFPVWLSPFTK